MWKRINEWLAFTRTERKVILFLGVVLVAGSGIRLYQDTFRSEPMYDYSRSDSTFAALSAALDEEDEPDAGPALVNLNSATKEELSSLSGIGAVLADRILEHRAKIGKFRSIEEIQDVRGISKKKFEKIQNSITISNSK